MAISIVIGILSLIVGVLYYYYYESQYWIRKGVVQVPGSLFLGVCRKTLKKSEPRLLVLRDWTKKYGKTYGMKEGTKNILVTSDFDVINEVFVKQFDNFYGRKAGVLSPDPDTDSMVNLFQSRGPRWKRLRALSVPTFSVASLKNVKNMIEDSAVSMVDIMEKRHGNGESFNIHRFFCEFTMDTVSKLVMGQEDSRLFNNPRVPIVQSFFLRDFDNPVVHTAFAFPFMIPIIKAIIYRLNTPLTTYSRMLRAEVFQAVHDRIAQREKMPEMIGNPKDMLDMFLDAKASNADIEDHSGFKLTQTKVSKTLSIDEVAMQVLIFILAGFDTTANSLAYTAWQLQKYPEVQRKCQEEIDGICHDERISFNELNELAYLEATCKETLRLIPLGAISNSRTCMKSTTVCGIEIEKGTLIEVDAYSFHVDKSIWGEDAEEFKPERWLDPNLKVPQVAYGAFGGGPRICIGMKLAIMEEKLALAHLLRRFSIVRGTEAEEMELHGALLVTPKETPMKIIPRK